MSRLTAIICAVVICLLVSLAWAINHYRGNAIIYKDQRDKATEKLILANATIKDMQTRQRDAAALDAKYTAELNLVTPATYTFRIEMTLTPSSVILLQSSVG